jgi:transposase-like protein
MTDEARLGRPPVVLSDEDRVRLVELAERYAVALAHVREVEADRRAAAVEVSERGGSLRAIAEALGLSREQVRGLLREDEE